MNRYEEWKKEEIARIGALDLDGVMFEIMNDEYDDSCAYCIYQKQKTCGRCTDGIKAYLKQEV